MKIVSVTSEIYASYAPPGLDTWRRRNRPCFARRAVQPVAVDGLRLPHGFTGAEEARVLGPLLEREGFWKTEKPSFCWEAAVSDLEAAVRAVRGRFDVLPLRSVSSFVLRQLVLDQRGAVQLGLNALDLDASQALFTAGKIQAALLLSGRTGETRVLELLYLRSKQFSRAMLPLLRASYDSLMRTDGPSAAVQIAGVGQAEHLLLHLAPHAKHVPFSLYRYAWLDPDYEARLIRQADEARIFDQEMLEPSEYDF